MVEGLPALFADLYNKFLLRDFVGKIVPGAVLWTAVALMFIPPVRLATIFRRLPVVLVIALAGLVWIMTLGIQSASEYCGLFSYFPNPTHSSSPDEAFKVDTLRVVEFMRGATDAEQVQYERFVVIKEACGNLFSAFLLSIPAWLFVTLQSRTDWHTPVGTQLKLTRSAYVLALAVFVVLGLARMHAQHVERQYMFADEVARAHSHLLEIVPLRKPQDDKNKDEEQKLSTESGNEK